jgi:hypothetical protein
MTLILELSGNKETALKAKAQAQGLSAEQYAETVLNRDLEEPPTLLRRSRVATFPRLSAKSGAISPTMLEALLPADGTSQVDHYVYGVPKRDQ